MQYDRDMIFIHGMIFCNVTSIQSTTNSGYLPLMVDLVLRFMQAGDVLLFVGMLLSFTYTFLQNVVPSCVK